MHAANPHQVQSSCSMMKCYSHPSSLSVNRLHFIGTGHLLQGLSIHMNSWSLWPCAFCGSCIVRTAQPLFSHYCCRNLIIRYLRDQNHRNLRAQKRSSSSEFLTLPFSSVTCDCRVQAVQPRTTRRPSDVPALVALCAPPLSSAVVTASLIVHDDRSLVRSNF
jgi:hypothetical protein